ncbi:N-acetylglucosamine-6-phosphate deacetylase [Dyadobacter jejuensis]|uniref:N-acetylglucosamine-6-phosphate deacetylase n=1 Tax=Dyadobacter jejuensis TaxID=1082580 RepID=A0A316AQ86_9BACT|nr:N-acetylglucosamine-6-phosphate deacetylase [Dyadobacter jejuensis]PWJ59304.1 N-acetylglucosamine-6-phosphate deacetylase [Dyadobacter jejuensis]
MTGIQQVFAANVYSGTTHLTHQVLTIREGRILTMAPGEPTEGMPSYSHLAPGLFDIHINGGEHFHFTQKPDEHTLADIDAASASSGTAYTLPTLITSDTGNILQGLQAVRNYQSKNPTTGVLGMHLEGPFINPKKRGAHLAQFVRKPKNSELKEIIHAGEGVLKMMTIAPEQFSVEQITMLQEAGIVISAGHSDATYQQAQAAFGQGIRLVTHLYNAMSAFHHRAPGLVGATFDHPEVYAPIIVDGVHCDYAAARVAYQLKKKKLILISDALFLHQKVTSFQWGDFDAQLVDGQYVNQEGNLAGGAITLGEAIHNAVTFLGIPPIEALEMATSRPAMAMGLSEHIGQIAPGYPAVFTAFNPSLTNFEVLRF